MRSFSHGVNMVYPTEAIAMFVNHTKGFNGNQGQNQGNRGSKRHSKKEKPICSYCGLSGHIANKCYKLHGYPLGYKHKGSNQAMANKVSAILPLGNFGNLDGFDLANPHLTQNNAGFPNHSFHSEDVLAPRNPLGAQFVSQVQCEQLLNYLKAITTSGLGIDTHFAHQVATVMAPAPSV